ncbi:pyroglutamyl peptidase [Homoserinibacter sp. YIM 151385]|uniref:pyroglutamyl peptidase n=1 Tax=Homoserinibacter sp. YIM 151385 TaxID=2985506 RepID=UPI0022EFE22F|nr:pyroglutamyl peptidase [Homoserinibacter sp. YIM 151385]WBU37151.1 pyroglutamyl peptidase [Homoserinibacter sp. YIM 151385]
MSASRSPRRPTSAALALALGVGLVGCSAPQQASSTQGSPTVREHAGDCFTTGVELTVEEQRLAAALPGEDVPAGEQLMQGSGFDAKVADFERALCAMEPGPEADDAVRAAGAELWRTAVERAQGEPEDGAADAYDDRPLYWARTAITKALRAWSPKTELDPLQRQALIHRFSSASRGIDEVDFEDTGDDATRVLVSGFDPFGLDDSLRTSNPSGAAALQLDGRVIDTDRGQVRVQAVMLPVNWSDFDQGIVEDAFGPWLVPDDHPEHAGDADLVMTLSQTDRGRMDIEQWAGGFRGGDPDNSRALNWGPVSASPRWPQPQPSPQFIETTLPAQQMIDAETGPLPVTLNPGVFEWPAGTYPDSAALTFGLEPSPNARAAAGSGGNYLSNESMYRVNRLRLGAGKEQLPGGHLHISALEYPEDPAELTSAAFESDRAAIVDQTVALIGAAAQATRESPRLVE